MASDITLKDALSVLSKSSPQAVEVEKSESNQNQFKEYLFIKTDIEKDFSEALMNIQPGEIIFLCGSSGDGKSAILTRYSQKRISEIKFHLDATHSLNPHSDAINELDKLFLDINTTQMPLVVGINVGMMGNYAEGGSEKLHEIKSSMKAHIQGNKTGPKHTFFDFERYPKFEFRDNAAHSNFAEAFLKRLTQPDDNPFLDLLHQHEMLGDELMLCANFKLLMRPEVQRVVVEALMKARLIKDQFMTSRALLDFIHHLLTSPQYLFDNLYAAADNELSQRITGFDPANSRTKKIDHFILQLMLALPNSEFSEFQNALTELGIQPGLSPESYIRLFYMLQGAEFSNNYHQQFSGDFASALLQKFARVWELHNNYSKSASKEDAIELNAFYNEILLDGLRRYMNRRAPNLKKKQYFLSEYNQVITAAELSLKPNLIAIARSKSKHSSSFSAFLKIGEASDSEIIVNINLYELLIKLKTGYRPNKHDKSTVLILDELVSQIIEIANQNDQLYFIDQTVQFEVEMNDEFIQVD